MTAHRAIAASIIGCISCMSADLMASAAIAISFLHSVQASATPPCI